MMAIPKQSAQDAPVQTKTDQILLMISTTGYCKQPRIKLMCLNFKSAMKWGDSTKEHMKSIR